MGKIILITGGSRSGKSIFAQKYAEGISPKKLFVATCPILDQELRDRVARHQADRAGLGWETVEEETELAKIIAEHSEFPVILIDCLTLWINNLMYRAELENRELTEDDIQVYSAEIIAACRAHPVAVLMVTNETGMGIVPENPLARRFRDLAGRCNQCIAAEADEVALLVSGLPLFLKKSLA